MREHGVENQHIAFFEQARSSERYEVGEDFEYGPGYASCIRDYFQAELGVGRPNNQLLDVLAEKKSLPRDRIVPVMASSCSIGEYLHDCVAPEDIMPLSTDLDIIVCRTSDEATRFRQDAPILLPLDATQSVIAALNEGQTLRTDRKHGKHQREFLRSSIAKIAGMDAKALSLHLGGDEVIKALFRGLTSNGNATMFVPLPNYFDAISFARQYHVNIVSDNPARKASVDAWAERIGQTQPGVVYLSNPNNPLGYHLDLSQLREIMAATPVTTRVVVDEVNLSRQDRNQLFSTPWRQLRKDFPEHHLIVIDSFSKSHNLVTSRVGMAYTSHPDDAELLRVQEPPRFSSQAPYEVGRTLLVDPVERSTVAAMESFYRELERIAQTARGALRVFPSQSNFCTIFFNDEKMSNRFLEYVKGIDPRTIPARCIAGVPKIGAGEITVSDLTANGTLKDEALSRKGILNLPKSAVRLSTLSHRSVLGALERALRD